LNHDVDDPHLLDPGTAPTPFTAAEIRAGCPAGRVTTTLTFDRGEQPYLRLNRFLAVDEDGADCVAERQATDGTRLGEIEPYRATWLQFQSHASFPEEVTQIEDESITVGIGAVDCWRYTVTGDDDVTEFWFAKQLPGMPVKVVVRDAQGVAHSSEMIENEMPQGLDRFGEKGDR
jgi:hypothetical protein